MRSSRGSRRRTRSNAISNAIVPCAPAVSRRALPGALTVLALGGLLVESGGTAWAAPVDGNAGEAATQSAPLLLAQSMPPISTSVALGETGAPVVSIMQPGYADLLKGKTSILIGVNSFHEGAQTVEMFLDGLSATGGPVALIPSPTTEFKFDTTLFTDGPHRLKVKVTDAKGFIGQSEVTIYINNGRKVDVTPPLLRWLNVQSGDLLRGDVKFRLQASDKFGVKYVFVYVTPAATPNGQAVRIMFANRPPYVFDFDTTLVPDGVYSISARAQDAMLNEGRAPMTYVGIVNRTINPTIIQTDLDSAIRSLPEATPPIPTVETRVFEGNSKVAAPLSAPQQGTTGAPKTLQSGTLNTGSEPRVAESDPSPTRGIRTTPLDTAIAAPPENAMTTIPHRARPSAASTSASTRAPGVNSVVTDAPVRIGALPSTLRRALRSTQPAPSADSRHMSTHAPATASSDAMTVMHTAPSSLDAMRTGATRVVPNRETRQGAWLETSPNASHRGVQKPRLAKSGTTKTAATNANHQKPFATEIRPADPASFAVGRPPVAKPSYGADAQQNTSTPADLVIPGNQTLTAMRTPSLPSRADVQTPAEHSNVMRSSGLIAAPRNNGVSLPEVANAPVSITQIPIPALTSNPVPFDNNALISSSSGAQQSSPVDSPLLPGSLPGVLMPNASAHSMPENASQPFVAPRSTAPRVASLPPTLSNPRRGAIAAITVAPMSGDNGLPPLHVVAQGETLSSIAARFHVPSAVLAASNNLKPSARVLAGTTLRLPRPLKVSFGGKAVTGDVAALMVGSTSVTPFRFLFEQQGGSLAWDGTRQQVVARNATQEITLTIGSRAAVVNRQQVMMDLAAFLLSGRTMVPVRFFEKALHAQVDWEPVSGRLYISMAPPAH